MPVMQLEHAAITAEQQYGEVSDLTNIKLPLILEKKILMAPGVWNGLYYSPEEIQKAFMNTDWDDPKVRSLFLDHVDDATATWVGEVRNVVLEGDTIYGDLYIVDENTARKILFGAKFGISPTVIGDVPEGENVIKDFIFKNMSIVFTPAIKKAYINKELEGDNMTEEKKMQEEEKVEPQEEQEVQNEEKVEEISLSEIKTMLQELAQKYEELSKEIEKLKKKKEEYPEPYGEEEDDEKEKKKNEEELQEEDGVKQESVEKIEVANTDILQKLERVEQKLKKIEEQLVNDEPDRETIGGGVVIENDEANELLQTDAAMLELLKVTE